MDLEKDTEGCVDRYKNERVDIAEVRGNEWRLVIVVEGATR